jgi:putative transposase
MSYTNIIYHIVIRTKGSRRTIEESHERDLYAYIYTFIKSYHGVLYRVNGMSDHIHILTSLHPTIALSDFMRDLKTATSKFLGSHREAFPMFDGWSDGYFAATKGIEQREMVRQYIIHQKEHHKKESFRDEFLRMCRENQIPIDDKYI